MSEAPPFFQRLFKFQSQGNSYGLGKESDFPGQIFQNKTETLLFLRKFSHALEVKLNSQSAALIPLDRKF